MPLDIEEFHKKAKIMVQKSYYSPILTKVHKKLNKNLRMYCKTFGDIGDITFSLV